MNQRALAAVQQMLPEQFRDVPEAHIADLPRQLREPPLPKWRRIVLVAETARGVKGFATLMHAPDLRFCYLDFIAAARFETSQGIGGALYERAREECLLLGALGLFFECLPDDPADVHDRRELSQNIARLRFYERYGARPIDRTAYATPVRPSDTDQPYLVFDDLGTNRALRRDEARAIVRAILERNYAWLCPAEYVERVVQSFRDDPVALRPYRYVPAPVVQAPLRAPQDARVLLIMNDKHDIHHVRERGYVEAPVRISAIRKELNKLDLFRVAEPKSFPDTHVSEVHDPEYVRYLKRMCASLPADQSVYPYVFPVRNATRPPRDLALRAGYYCIDTFTPINRNAWPASRRAVDCALTAAAALLTGTRLAYALVRPPGHHAEHSAFGGFCYLNSAAIAAHYLSKHGRVAMLDIDYHHGNGQQEIFYRRSDLLTVSIHAHPNVAYPYFTGFPSEIGEGPGRGCNLNFALGEAVDGREYARILERALSRVRSFAPRFLVVCLGLDTAKADPTGTWSLRSADFERNGRIIGGLALPTLIVQEGGYNTRNLGTHARHFFAGLWAGAAAAGSI
ncbi:MAG TPA: histone deacetylase family protein [Polyangiales bacterium]|nr:histone deacetylase family protein [Polyangiales bacterium]